MYVQKKSCGAVTEEPHQTLLRIRRTLGITITNACSCESSFTDGSLHSLWVCLCVRVSCQSVQRLCWRRKREKEAGKVHRSDSMQIRVPDMKGVDKWWKGCKKRNAPSGMGGMPKHVTNRLPVADLQTAARVASFY